MGTRTFEEHQGDSLKARDDSANAAMECFPWSQWDRLWQGKYNYLNKPQGWRKGVLRAGICDSG